MDFGFSFLADLANFDIPFHLVAWHVGDSYARALLVCVLNTLLVSALGIIASTLLGLLVGIMRLSMNWLVRNIALVFVELVRNTPQLVQIAFWYVAVLQTLPSPRQSIVLPGGLLLNIRGLYLPSLDLGANEATLGGLALLLLLVTPFVWRFRFRGFRLGAKSLLLPLLAAAVFAAASTGWSSRCCAASTSPAACRFRRSWWRSGPGSASIPPPSSPRSCARPSSRCIAASASRPQPRPEAAPGAGQGHPAQAVRVMVPPMTSQYLNLIKSSSLGAAIAYPELFSIFAGTVLNQSGRELETIIILMLISSASACSPRPS